MLPKGTELGRLLHEKTYVYHDGPRVFLCSRRGGGLLLAMCTDSGVDCDEWLYLPLSSSLVDRLETEELPLDSVFQQPEDDGLYRVRTFRDGRKAVVVWITANDLRPDELPDAGFYLGPSVGAPEQLVLGVDGGQVGVGDVPLHLGNLLVQRLEKLVRVAARTEQGFEAAYSTLGAGARQYSNWLRLRFAEGSLRLVVQPPEAPLIDAAPGDEEPSQALTLLGRALGALRQAVDEGQGEFRAFEERVEEGVSANLCEALAALLEAQGPERFWFSLVPADGVFKVGPSRIEFSNEDVDRLKAGAEFLRFSAPVKGQVIEGPVVKLFTEDWATDGGEVAVGASLDGRDRLIRMFLTPEKYIVAWKAHGARVQVRCVGELERSNRGYRLRKVEKVASGRPIDVVPTDVVAASPATSAALPTRLYVRLTKSDTSYRSSPYIILPKAAVEQHPGFFGYPGTLPEGSTKWHRKVILRELSGAPKLRRIEWYADPGEFRIRTSLRNHPDSRAGCFMELVRESGDHGYSVRLHGPKDPEFAEITALVRQNRRRGKPHAWG